MVNWFIIWMASELWSTNLLCFLLMLDQLTLNKLKTAEKSSSTSFWVCAAPKSWSKYTTSVDPFLWLFSYFLHFLLFFSVCDGKRRKREYMEKHEKHLKIWFWPANGVRSTRWMVKVHNTCFHLIQNRQEKPLQQKPSWQLRDFQSHKQLQMHPSLTGEDHLQKKLK